MKQWSYEEITEKTETIISGFMRWHEQSDPSNPFYRDCAYGAFLMWAEVTNGHAPEGDSERLKAMTKPPKEDA